jgi:hypothetical protein
MMKLSVKKVQEIVRLAEQLYPHTHIHNQKIHSAADAADAVAACIQETKELHNYIKNLPDDERYELTALVWLGRGTGDEAPNDWESLVRDASGDTAEGTAEYLVSKFPLARYLREGMRKMGMN